LDAVALSAGPGSFTGLRIGAAMAKGICFDNTIKFIPVQTLESIAYSALHFINKEEFDSILVINNSNSDLYYFQKFSFAEFENDSVIFVSNKDDILHHINEKTYLCGTGAEDFAVNKLNEFSLPSARLIANLAYKKFIEGKFGDAESFVPMYVQEFVPR
jgi:tRNA threonylcarbamoyladenosine biosynthesis protein TsaB